MNIGHCCLGPGQLFHCTAFCFVLSLSLSFICVECYVVDLRAAFQSVDLLPSNWMLENIIDLTKELNTNTRTYFLLMV